MQTIENAEGFAECGVAQRGNQQIDSSSLMLSKALTNIQVATRKRIGKRWNLVNDSNRYVRHLWKGLVFGVGLGLAIWFAVANLSNIIKQSLDSMCACLFGSPAANQDVEGHGKTT